MRIRTGMGTTPTILVIVVTIGDWRPRVGGPCAALRARPARVARTGVTGIPATSATARREDATAGVARLLARRLWACREPRTACGERPVSAGRDIPTTCAGVVVVDVVAVDGTGAGVWVTGAGSAAALPAAVGGTCDVAGLLTLARW